MTRHKAGLSKNVRDVLKNHSYTFLYAALLASGCCLITGLAQARAAAPNEAKLTHIVQDVQIGSGSHLRAAGRNDDVGPGIPVHTGANSWAELGFTDQTIARLGQNSVFSFREGTRQLDFAEGALLLQVPKAARRAKLNMAGVAAEVTDTTCVCEFFHGGSYKFLVLQGTARLYRPGHMGDSILVRPGQMVIGEAGAPLSDPVDVDIGHFFTTSRFLVDFPPLPTAALIARESEAQQQKKSRKRLVATNLVILGRGTTVSMLNAAQVNQASSTAASARPAVPTAVPGSDELGLVELPPELNQTAATALPGTQPGTGQTAIANPR